MGTGAIESVKGNVVKGNGTMFTKTLNEKDTITLSEPKSSFFVTKIVDDQTLEVDNSKGVDFEGKQLNFTIVPKLDQSKVFDNTWKLLKAGKVVGIFPEVF